MPLWSIPLVFVGAFAGMIGILVGVSLIRKRIAARKEAKVKRDAD